MAQRVLIILEDDVDGSTAEETIQFGLDGKSYEIDLNNSNAATLRSALERWVGHARRSSGARKPSTVNKPSTITSERRPSAPVKIDRMQSMAIRQWARANGHQVGDKGRVAAPIMEAFERAHQSVAS